MRRAAASASSGEIVRSGPVVESGQELARGNGADAGRTVELDREQIHDSLAQVVERAVGRGHAERKDGDGGGIERGARSRRTARQPYGHRAEDHGDERGPDHDRAAPIMRRARRRRDGRARIRLVQRGERRRQLGRAGIAVGRRLGQEPLEHEVQRRWDRLAQSAGGGDRIGEALGHDRLRGRPGVRRLAGQQLVDHAAQAVEIGAAVERGVAERLLRAHVGRGADREPGLGETVARAGLERAGHPEIGEQRVRRHARLAAGGAQEHVLGLEVAVHDAVRVGVRQCVRQLGGPAEDVGERLRAAPAETVAEALALHQRHGVPQHRRAQAGLGGDLAGIEEGKDVGVLKARGEADLAQEPVGAQAGGQLGPEDLDRDRAIVADVVGAIDHGHAAAAELPLESVAVGEGNGKAAGRVGQRAVRAGLPYHIAEEAGRPGEGGGGIRACSRSGRRHGGSLRSRPEPWTPTRARTKRPAVRRAFAMPTQAIRGVASFEVPRGLWLLARGVPARPPARATIRAA